MFGGEALEPQRLRTWVEQPPGFAAADQHVRHHRDDGACLVPGDRRRRPRQHRQPHRGAAGPPRLLRPRRLAAAGAGGCGRRVVCGRRRCWRMAMSGGRVCRRRGLWRARSGRPGSGCIAPGIWCGGVPTGSCATWGAPTSRSRSAGTASSSARCRPRWPGWTGWSRRW